jgi:hypothetical protein
MFSRGRSAASDFVDVADARPDQDSRVTAVNILSAFACH